MGTIDINISKTQNINIKETILIAVMLQKVSEICFLSPIVVEIWRVPVIENPRSEKIIKIVDSDWANITSPNNSVLMTLLEMELKKEE